MRLKLETMTGTGRAITSTPLKEQIEPKIFPAIVFGTMSPYLQEGDRDKGNILDRFVGMAKRKLYELNC